MSEQPAQERWYVEPARLVYMIRSTDVQAGKGTFDKWVADVRTEELANRIVADHNAHLSSSASEQPAAQERWEARPSLVASWEVWQVWEGNRQVADFIVTKEEADYICALHNARLSSSADVAQEGESLKYHEYVAKEDGVYMHVPELGYGLGEKQTNAEIARRHNALTAALKQAQAAAENYQGAFYSARERAAAAEAGVARLRALVQEAVDGFEDKLKPGSLGGEPRVRNAPRPGWLFKARAALTATAPEQPTGPYHDPQCTKCKHRLSVHYGLDHEFKQPASEEVVELFDLDFDPPGEA